MKVLLLEDVRALGKKGQIVEVKDGYGNNFLIAKGKANLATNEVINKYKAAQKRAEEEAAQNRALLEMTAKKLAQISIKLKAKSGEGGALFGAITKDEIANALSEQARIELDKKCLEIKNPIKNIGTHEIEAKLGGGLNAKFTLIVESV